MKKFFTAILVGSALVGGFDVTAAAQQPPKPDGDTAVLTWAAFECSVYAEMSAQPQKERERLFQLGYDSGKRFLEAARSGAITQAEISAKVPIGITMNAGGPTVDFALGRIYAAVSEDSYDSIVKSDLAGLPLPIDKWMTGDDYAEVRKQRAESEYRSSNCGLLK